MNQYTSFDGWGLAYDLNGNTTQKGGQRFYYDYRNQLVRATDTSTTTGYKYDALGRRIEKSYGVNVSRYYYSGDQVIEERNASDQVAKQFTYGNGIDEILRIEINENGTMVTYYVHTDAIGSVTAITDAAGNVVERVSYDIYGMPTFTDYRTDPQNPAVVENSIIGNDILFQGRRYDQETNLYYYRARYYDPIMGRFMQTDPMGYHDSMNMYQAFNQNPVNFVDPMGERLIIANNQQSRQSLHEIASSGGRHPKNTLNYATFNGTAIQNAQEVISINYTIDTAFEGPELLDKMIKSPHVYYFAIDTSNPSRNGVQTITAQGSLGSHIINNDSNPDVRFEFRVANNATLLRNQRIARQHGDPLDANTYKNQSMLPPQGIDGVVVIAPGFFNQRLKYGVDPKRIARLYPRDNAQQLAQRITQLNATIHPMSPNEVYFTVFHELAEAYYKLSLGMQYVDLYYRNTPNAYTSSRTESPQFSFKIEGAHSRAIRAEERWRKELGITTDFVGGHVNIR